MNRTPLKASAAILALLTQSAAMAQSIGYAPATSAVPTLSEWATYLLALSLAVVGVYVGRQAGHKGLMVVTLGVAALLGIGTQRGLMSEAMAIQNPQMTSGVGGEVNLSPYSLVAGEEIEVQGHPTIAMLILNVTPASDEPTTNPTCKTGLVVPAGQSCHYKMPGTPG